MNQFVLRSFNIKYSKLFFLKKILLATTCPAVYSNIQVHTGRYKGFCILPLSYHNSTIFTCFAGTRVSLALNIQLTFT